MDKKRQEIIQGNEISELVTVRLGKFDQEILIEGKTANLPIIITLHGGPGVPIPFGVGSRGLFPEFTDKCIMVYWDQYGCGINNAKLPDDIGIDDFANMTVDLIDAVKKRFPANKLYLLGVSWGSVLAAKAAVKKGYALGGVLIYGQVLRELMQSNEIRRTISESNAPKRVKNEVESAFENKEFTPKFAMKLSGYIRKYTNGYNNPNEPKAPMKKLIKGYRQSPDYRFKDFLAVVKNGYVKNRSIVAELSKADLSDDLKRITVPYKILQGDTDIVTSTSMIRAFVESSGNPMLSCTVVKDSAHMAGMNGMDAIMKEIELISKDRF